MSIYIYICTKNSVFFDYDNLPLNLDQKYFGAIDTFDSNFYLNINQQDVYLIKFINHSNNVVFNKKQMIRLQGEINSLKKGTLVKESILILLETAISYGLQQDDVYLKCEID